MTSIPANALVSVTPNVLAAGGTALALSALLLTASAQVPVGVVQKFGSAAEVSSYFGGSSTEAALAATYFLGADNSNTKPGALLMAQYNSTAVAAYLRGAPLSSMTLAQLQALGTGSVVVVMDGYTHTAAAVNLSGASSFSNAASLINTAINASQPQQASFTGAISGTTLTVSAMTTGALAVGQTVAGGATSAGTIITALGTGTGGTGTYTVNNTQTVGSGALTTTSTPIVVDFDSVSSAFRFTSGITGAPSTAAFATGTLAANLKLNSATGAVLSQGAAAQTPSAFMDRMVAISSNWVTFTTVFDPDNGSGTTNRLAFAQWTSNQNNRYAYIAWDTDASPTTSINATNSLGQLISAASYSGTWVQWVPTASAMKAIFVCGAIASIDTNQTNGRTNLCYRRQSGLAADVTDALIATNLLANHYNFYGAYGTAAQDFLVLNNGSVSGPFLWMDSYIDQIAMNASFQLALMILLTNAKSIPYNLAGNTMIEAALNDTILQYLDFGAIRAGVPLSALQASEVNSSAGVKIDNVLQNRGWYLQVKTASPSVRAARGSPPCTFWYMDGQSVQKINLASVELQ